MCLYCDLESWEGVQNKGGHLTWCAATPCEFRWLCNILNMKYSLN